MSKHLYLPLGTYQVANVYRSSFNTMSSLRRSKGASVNVNSINKGKMTEWLILRSRVQIKSAAFCVDHLFIVKYENKENNAGVDPLQ